MANPAKATPHVWAVGGGKGGVGKSIVTSSLAIALARRGERVVVLDADLGGANLHTVLGVSNPKRTLSHFINKDVKSLASVMCPTPVPNLWLISGNRALMEMANIKHTQKEKLLRHVRTLDVDHVFLDLGAGSAFNVLDFFLAAQRGLLVVVPEPTSIENAYQFLKAAFYRSLRNAARQLPIRNAIHRVLEEKAKQGIRSPRELIRGVSEIDPEAGEVLRAQASVFRPLLIVNQVRTAEHRQLGSDMVIACRDYLGSEIEYLGALDHDERVVEAVFQRRPVVELFPTSDFSKSLSRIAEQLLNLASAR